SPSRSRCACYIYSFRAEDGIRDFHVTGVQTCALPISGGRMSAAMLLPTSLLGSHAPPDWLIDRAKLAGRFPPRTRAKELWRVDDEFLEQAWDDATLIAIREQEVAGLDIITD